MKLFLYLLFIVQILFTWSPALANSSRPTVSKEPAWISKNNIDYNQTILDKHAADGYIDISYEIQVSLADQSEYIRSSRKIISQAGVQNGSEISVSYDPSFEQLIFHTIRIIREGQTINKLQLSNIKTVRQEKELAEFIYNGSVDAILILEDVRQGDIIEYSYTTKGYNPIFKNKYAREFSMEFSFPFYELYYKLIVPAGRKINIKNINQTTDPVITSVNGQQVYEWRKKNIAPLPLQDYTPSWYDPYAQILISEYNNWKEVNDWAMELFPREKKLSAEVQAKIKEIETAHSSDSERTKAALRFVQDDIRYMGIEMGVNSHKPADPSKVFAQRFGDCKEKSYLLCCMLRAMHIDARPVLINTVDKQRLNTLLPAPTNFDHVTVRVKLDSGYYWFDPTIAYQRGSIYNLFYPDYQAGLIISDSTVSLTPIVFRSTGSQHIKEHFKIPSMQGSGSLIVTTTFQGNEADDARDNYSSQSITELMTSYQKFYAYYYEDIKADSLVYTDNDSTGLFTTTEYYTIPNIWTLTKSKVNKFSLSSFIISNIIRRPKEKNRSMPFRLAYPTKYEEEVIVDLPDQWKVTESETHLKNNCFTYNAKFYSRFNHVYLETNYENFKDHAAVDEAPVYFKDLGEFEDANNFDLTSTPDDLVSKQSSPSGNIFIVILIVGVFAGAVIWWGKHKT